MEILYKVQNKNTQKLKPKKLHNKCDVLKCIVISLL